MQELLQRSAEIIDHFCVYNYQAIQQKFPCLSQIDKEVSRQCLKGCTSQHEAVLSLLQNFKQLALNGDSSQAEAYLSQSCEYVICTLHCDVPAIAHKCDFDTADLVINLTRKSFASMERLALDTGAVSKWPTMCSDIKTYRLPKPGDIKDQPLPPTSIDEISASGPVHQARAAAAAAASATSMEPMVENTTVIQKPQANSGNSNWINSILFLVVVLFFVN
uniref:Chondroitin proteoglycan 4 domain-containing protein n=1 Tax=Panagrolaimus davidi TaxID=227884 RepID=A0A914P3D3_9BILA